MNRSHSFTSVYVVLIALGVSSAVVGQTKSKSPPTALSLQARIDSLEESIARLDARLRAVEGRPMLARDQPKAIGFEELDGKAVITADDGTFLGIISSDTFSAKSIMNSVGSHGSSVAGESIFNTVGRYGGTISTTSPWNEMASKPPRIFAGETFVGYLSTNTFKTPRIDPHALVGYLKSKK